MYQGFRGVSKKMIFLEVQIFFIIPTDILFYTQGSHLESQTHKVAASFFPSLSPRISNFSKDNFKIKVSILHDGGGKKNTWKLFIPKVISLV